MTLPELDDSVRPVFVDFMTRVARFDELANMGNQLLSSFQQELGKFRRSPLQKESKVILGIIEANRNERLSAYLEAGCRLGHIDKVNISKLHVCQEALQEYMDKAKALIREFDCLMDDVIAIMQKAIENLSHFLDTISMDNLIVSAAGTDKVGTRCSMHHGLEVSDYFVMMRVVYNMYKLDYIMQENIVSSLSLRTSEEELESYCLMWDLRPYINDNIMQRCWRWSSK